MKKNSGPLEYTHSDSFDLIQEEDLQNLDARSISQYSDNYRSSLGTFNKKEDNPEFMEGTADAGNKMSKIPQEEISSTDEHSQTSQVIENPCTQIFKFMHPNLDNLREKSFLRNNESGLLKCPEYESDEFADVEDNSKESFDYKDLPNDAMALMKQGAGYFREGREMDKQASESMERTTTVLPARSEADLLNDKNVPSTSHTQSYNIDASCSHDRDPKYVPDLPAPAKSEESKLNLKMPTIDEVSELNGKINPKDNTSSRPNPLKMKAKVGRKDKCNVCRVRLGLCAIRCRCGGYYCAKHRYDKEHNCTFDYKSMGAEEIRKNNPRVIAEKVRKL